MLPFTVGKIETVVHDFDFAHVIKFLNGLSEKHFKALKAKDCWLRFSLSFTAANLRARSLQRPELDKWLHFFGKFSAQRGGMFSLCSYQAKENSDNRSVRAWIPELREKRHGGVALAEKGSELQYGRRELGWIVEEFEYHFK